MSFEERFPELKESNAGVIIGGKFVFDKDCKCWFNFQDIQKHCLSKQRVKEAIEKVRKYSPTIIDDLLEELGLE